MVAVGTIPLIVGLSSGDGADNEHLLTESETRLYIARYNRALLRKVVRETQSIYRDIALRQMPARPTKSLRLRPLVGPGGLGLQGEF